jgi:ABC-type nitrate/sulfonate/bicarbonate transport system substrate-binding protein
MTFSLTRRQFNNAMLSGMAAGALGLSANSAHAAETVLNFQSIWINDPEFLGYYIAMENGFYAAEGLKLNYMPGGPNLIPEGALLTGKADVALTGVINTAQAINKGAQLKIIGTQFQKNPQGVISLEASNIKEPKDLIGKTIACPPLSLLNFKAMLIANSIPTEQVKIVPYAFDPTPLATGSVDAVFDFITSLPFIVEQKSGKKTRYFLAYDWALPFYIDAVTVTAETLKTKRKELLGFIRASRKGWVEDFADPSKYLTKYAETWFKGNGYTPEAAEYHSKVQIAIMEHPKGVFFMDDDGVQKNLDSLAKVGVKASKDLFDTSILAEV